jgi:succinate dehydrogenase / fumarate reductase iron-sulfur subunit
MSFLEMLDVLNEQIIKDGGEPIQFDSDCREGICGSCGLVINGIPHGKPQYSTTCQVYMRHFQNGQTITIEPFRAKAFPIIKDLVVDRSAFDRIMEQGGYISRGEEPEANTIPIPKELSDRAMDMAECIGCGACVAACPNASASLFLAAKISQYTFLPQGQGERQQRAKQMVEGMDQEGFGNCSNHGICSTICPKEIPLSAISNLRTEYIKALLSR